LDMKFEYFEDVKLLRTTGAKVWFVILMIGLVVLPFTLPGYALATVSLLATYVIVAIGMNILVGYTGLISLGHAGFFAVGAYTTVLTMDGLGLPFFLALLSAGLLAAALGFALGLPALRLEGPYLTIATMGFGLAVIQVIGRVQAFGGHMGLAVPDMSLFGWVLNSDVEKYFVIMIVTVLLTGAARNLMRGRIGRAFRAIRDSDIAAETLGVNLAFYKTLSFAISAFYAGVAGGLAAFVIDFISPGQFNFVLSVLFLAMVVVGGRGSILGSILGGVVVGYLSIKMQVVEELPLVGTLLVWLSEHVFTMTGLPNAGWVFTGLIMILAVAVEPLGLYGVWIRTKGYWKAWPF
jgi:branched-chain amino acid transport system permease protein